MKIDRNLLPSWYMEKKFLPGKYWEKRLRIVSFFLRCFQRMLISKLIAWILMSIVFVFRMLDMSLCFVVSLAGRGPVLRRLRRVGRVWRQSL